MHATDEYAASPVSVEGMRQRARRYWRRCSLGQALDLISLKLVRRIEIRHRLILSFIALSLLPLVVSGFLSHAEFSRAIQAKTRVLLVEVVRQVARNMQLQMGALETAGEDFAMSNRVQVALADYYGRSEGDRVRARSALTRSLLEKYGSSDHINQKYLLDNQYRMMDTQVFPELGDSIARLAARSPPDGEPTWKTYRGSAGQKSIAMLRTLHAKHNNAVAGTLFIGVKASQFSAIFDGVLPETDAAIYLLDISDGSVIVAGRRDGPGPEDIADPALVSEIRQQAAAGRRTDFTGFTGRDRLQYQVAYSRIAQTPWFVVNAVPLQSLMAEPRALRDKILLIGAVCFAFALLFSWIIARSISMPIGRLVAVMQETESGNYRIRMQPQGQDEVTLLSQKFNDMASRVHEQNERLEDRVAERTRDLALATRSLEILSATDGLTGLANRRRFDDVLASEVQRATRAQQPLTLLMLDVDLFKNYNDFYGHQAGDACLRDVADFLQSRSRRASDLIARYGGEEFAFIGVDTDAESALELADTICTALLARAIPHARSPFGYVTLSIGVATLVPAIGTPPAALIRMADAALYRAKNEGRNRACAASGTATPILQAS